MGSITTINANVPAHIAARMKQPSSLAQSLASGLGGGPEFPRISIKGSRFRIKDGDAETVLKETELPVIIVGANPRLSKAYFAKAWDPDADAVMPDCYSLDGVRPHPESESPQNDLCATCEFNKFGSKITPQGTETKACADKKRLAVVAANSPEGPVYLLEVTPAALKGLNAYQKQLTMRGLSPELVVTTVGFDTNASFPKLSFDFGGFLEEDAMAAVDSLLGSEEVITVTGEREVPVATPPAKPKPTLVKAKPEPVEEEAEEKPLRGFGMGKPAPAEEKPARGFGAPKAAPPAEEKPKATRKAAAKPVVAEATTVDALADEIASMFGEEGADDAD